MITDDPKYSNSRNLWHHEDILINHRLTWLGVTEGLLFGAFGFAGIQQTSEKILQLQSLISYIGLGTSIAIFAGIFAAIISQFIIKNRYQWPKYGVTGFTTIVGWITALSLPSAFVIAWSVLLANAI